MIIEIIKSLVTTCDGGDLHIRKIRAGFCVLPKE